MALLVTAAPLAAQSDTTIRIDVRVRSAAPVHDTVTRTVQLPAVHDTLKVPAWTQYFYWTPYLQGDSIRWQFASNNNDPTMPPAIVAPRVSGGTTVRVDTVTLVRAWYWKPVVSPDSIRWAVDSTTVRPGDLATYPRAVVTPRDTVRLPPIVVTPPPANGVALPRASVDTRMPSMPVDGRVIRP